MAGATAKLPKNWQEHHPRRTQGTEITGLGRYGYKSPKCPADFPIRSTIPTTTVPVVRTRTWYRYSRVGGVNGSFHPVITLFNPSRNTRHQSPTPHAPNSVPYLTSVVRTPYMPSNRNLALAPAAASASCPLPQRRGDAGIHRAARGKTSTVDKQNPHPRETCSPAAHEHPDVVTRSLRQHSYVQGRGRVEVRQGLAGRNF